MLGAVILVGVGGAVYVCMGLNNSQFRPPHVPPTADERAVINYIITTMKDEIARVEETVADAYRDALESAAPPNRWRVLAAKNTLYRAGFAERWLRYMLEGRSNVDILDLEGVARRPWALMLWPRRALDSACYVFAQISRKHSSISGSRQLG